jgi:hypothetical protein
MNVYVFLGPTMPVEEARRLCPAEYLPPVSMGDVYALMERRPSTIAIIDGTFQNKPAVWHKEILFAISRGVRVVGSSSMGALRAAELHGFGMEGTGAIFEAFRDGVYEDDDEVAVAHAAAEHGFRALSEAMVNVRAGLAEAQRRGLITSATTDTLVARTKGLFYPDRSWPRIFQIGRDDRLPADEMAALESFVRTERPNLKRADAVRLLRQLASLTLPKTPETRPSFTFESSWFWKKLVETEEPRRDALRACGQPADCVNHAALVRHVRFCSPDREDLLRSALLLHLIDRQAGTATSYDDEDDDENEDASASAATAEADVLATRLARLEKLGQRIAATRRSEIERFLPIELRRRGDFDKVAKEVESKWQSLLESGLTASDINDTDLDADELLAWLSERCGRPAPIDLETLATELGFASADELRREATIECLVDRLTRKRDGPRD